MTLLYRDEQPVFDGGDSTDDRCRVKRKNCRVSRRCTLCFAEKGRIHGFVGIRMRERACSYSHAPLPVVNTDVQNTCSKGQL